MWLGDRCSDPDCGKQVRHKATKVTPCPKCRQQYPQVHLSERSADMLKSLEEAGVLFGQSITAEEHHERYSRLTAVREVVYKRLEQLEKLAGVTNRPAAFRF